MRRGSVCSRICPCVCLSVCLSVCNALTFERLDLEASFLVCRYTFKIPRSSSYIEVTWSRSRSQEGKCVSVCTVRALNFECIDLGRSFFIRGHIVRISRSYSFITVIGSRSRSHEQKKLVCVFWSQVVYRQLKGSLVQWYGCQTDKDSKTDRQTN